MSTHSTTNKTSRWAMLAVFVPGLLVALGAAAATAHGLFEVAVASGVPGGIAWIYPLITDGLAIVAYAATSRLQERGRGYAWAVVILAAGLSGLAQASYLAGGVGTSAAPVGAEALPPTSGLLRFGVGAWPALAAAIVAHLLFMLATERRTDADAAVDEAAVPAAGAAVAVADPAASSAPLVEPDRVQRPAVQSPVVQSGAVQPGALNASASTVPGGRTAEPSPGVQSEGEREAGESPAKPERPAAVASSPKKDRARAEARKHQARTGSLPTVDELMELAEVSRGTAGTALQELRQQPAPLHVITELTTQQANS
ncbi:DUF2637 domain-containing protein [Amycolatopsis sp. FDAARGOS 1241]|uniref:DUF2637 domain-containing protein n=1 Tax=Amycolatopsis sp. FDAARGOS 1241 TaxID=2778070 RepID=UPI0019515FE9|nr:DUF2637 domain-containing protein [Amycolatopsis sp. FDAARGOS 1241]QRP46040.1 hypothetical protein I6J71_44505 [Amycolatopsis sp. FDAARGOS 1241]